MKRLSDIEKWKLLVRSDVNQAASDFSALSAEESARMAGELGTAYMTEMVSRLGSGVAAEVLRSLPESFREKVIEGLEPGKAGRVRDVLRYAPRTAGALMAKEFLAIPIGCTIGQATDYLQSLPADKKGKVSYIYVIDAESRLEGVIQIRDLVFHSPERTVRDILIGPVVQVETGMQQLDVARLLQRHKYLGLPVVDEGQRLVGVISADAAMRALEAEASDDIAKIVGTDAAEISANSVRSVVRYRLPWLFVNIASGLLCAWIAGIFQRDTPTVALLFLFVPVVLGLCESIGVQGATIVVRNITLGNIDSHRLGRLFLRETMAGIIIGSVCGAVVGGFAYLWKANTRVGLALVGSLAPAIILSAMIGLLLPLFFRKLKIDPAIGSGPLVLALCDTQALLVYFNLSNLILTHA